MLAILAFIIGVSLGSFINVVVIRLAVNEKINGRSHCRDCGAQLAWYHNIPLLSYIFLRGKCASCRQHISWQYPIVEATAGILFLLGVYVMPIGDWLWLITFWVLAAYCLTLFLFDFKYKVLPDVVTLSGAVVIFILNLLRGLPLTNLLLAAAIAAGFFAVQYFISRGKWLGSGDIRLGALMGLSLGWPKVAAALIISYWVGALVGVILILFKNYGPKSEIAFGTLLTVSTVFVFIAGDWLVQAYYLFLGF